MKVAFLAGRDSTGVRSAIRRVAAIGGIQPISIVYLPICPGFLTDIRRHGLLSGFWIWLRRLVSRWLDAPVKESDVADLLARAHPDRDFSLAGLAERLKVPLQLRLADAPLVDLWIALDAHPPPATAARLGVIQWMRGGDPLGDSPGFWDLLEGRSSSSAVIVWRPTGQAPRVAAKVAVELHPLETPESLDEKLAQAAGGLLVPSVEGLLAGSPLAGEAFTESPARLPAVADRRHLANRLPHWRYLADSRVALRGLASVILYRLGVWRLRHAMRRAEPRAAIILYHRVNDFSEDPLTTSTRRFAQHLLLLQRWYRPVSTATLVEAVTNGKGPPPAAAAIHFDDCYQDVLTDAAPILRQLEMTAMFFVSTGFLDSNRVFEHDRAKYPWRFPNLTRNELQQWASEFELGAHTVNHIDLGKAGEDEARKEMEESGRELREITGRSVDCFAFPFGTPAHFRPEYRPMLEPAGFRAMFSAHGGFLKTGCDPLDIPRIGVSSDQTPVEFLLDLEEVSLRDLLGQQRSRW
jgi:peptidoglycan/xylan/chitin deacetylase (PgdA/CDA1 family)